jgi:hypothetical protein
MKKASNRYCSNDTILRIASHTSQLHSQVMSPPRKVAGNDVKISFCESRAEKKRGSVVGTQA